MRRTGTAQHRLPVHRHMHVRQEAAGQLSGARCRLPAVLGSALPAGWPASCDARTAAVVSLDWEIARRARGGATCRGHPCRRADCLRSLQGSRVCTCRHWSHLIAPCAGSQAALLCSAAAGAPAPLAGGGVWGAAARGAARLRCHGGHFRDAVGGVSGAGPRGGGPCCRAAPLRQHPARRHGTLPRAAHHAAATCSGQPPLVLVEAGGRAGRAGGAAAPRGGGGAEGTPAPLPRLAPPAGAVCTPPAERACAFLQRPLQARARRAARLDQTERGVCLGADARPAPPVACRASASLRRHRLSSALRRGCCLPLHSHDLSSRRFSCR